jgi:hypothetical protein
MSLAKGFCVLKTESTKGWCHNRGLQFDKKRQTGLGPARTMRLWLKVQSFEAAPQGFAKKHPRFFVDEIHSG